MAIKAGNLGRHKVISRSGLQAVLQDLKEGDFPSATSRQSIKRQRDEQVCLETPFGNLLQMKSFSLLTGKKKKAQESKVVDVPFVSPIPLLYHLCRECDEFSKMMLKVLDVEWLNPSVSGCAEALRDFMHLGTGIGVADLTVAA